MYTKVIGNSVRHCDYIRLSFITQNYVRGIPNYDHPYGLIRFDRSIRKKPAATAEEAAAGGAEQPDDFKAFQGQGFSLKKGKK